MKDTEAAHWHLGMKATASFVFIHYLSLRSTWITWSLYHLGNGSVGRELDQRDLPWHALFSLKLLL